MGETVLARKGTQEEALEYDKYAIGIFNEQEEELKAKKSKNWFMLSKKKCLRFNIILKLEIIVYKEKLLAVNETKF